MRLLEEEKSRRQQEKIDRMRNLNDVELDCLNQEGEMEKQKILDRFTKKKPPHGRRD